MKKLLKNIKIRYKWFKKSRQHKKKLKEMRKRDPFIYD
jgi:hypothetical protein